MRTFVKGDGDYSSADSGLQAAVTQFNAAFAHYSGSIVLRTFEQGTRTFDAIEGIIVYPISYSFKVFDKTLQ
jgi:hypothetical protein